MFSDIKNWDKNNLNSYTYCDIKLNAFFTNEICSLIGEIIFMLDFMVDAKKLGHIFYSFVRNEDIYRDISKRIIYNLKQEKEIESIILRKDYKLLIDYLLFGELDKNKDNINSTQLLKICKLSKWAKGY